MPGGNSVGQVSLDLVLNRNPFNKQMNNLQQTYKGQLNNLQSMTSSAMSKMAKTLGMGLSVAGLTAFAKKCIDLGSDLSEVQNVVDVTFGSMSDKVNEFAQNAATQFGLSETMAKQFVGTFGAMGKAFGFSQDSAYEMSTTLAGLAGDIASFYNLDQEDAFTKLKAVFTGETEGLKSLGVVMTQTALDQFALANGFGKTTAQMSEQEKVALRYQFVLNQLSGASGDFARTSGGWANQVRILRLQFESFSAAIGQGLINVLTPALKMINNLMAGLVKLAQAFKGFTELITGKKSTEGSGIANIGDLAADAGTGMEDASGAADDLSDSTAGVGDAAKKAAKEMRSLMGFDQINAMSANGEDASSGSGSSPKGTSSGGTGPVGAMDLGKLAEGEEDANGMSKALDGLIKRAKELRDIFGKGFAAGLGNVTLEPLKRSAESIMQSLKEIFGSKEVQDAANRFLNTFAYSMGQQAGAITSIGITMATNLVGGIDRYLAQNQGRIKSFIVNSFDAASDIMAMAGNYAQAIAYILSPLGGEHGQQLTANIIGIFSDAVMGITQLGLNFVRDITNLVTQPIIDNQESLRQAFEGTLAVFETVTGAIKTLVDGIVDKALEVYDNHFRPMFDALAEGISSIVATATEAYNEYILPVLQGLADRLGPFVEDYLLPMVNSILEFIGKLADLFTTIRTKTLFPFIEWFIKTMAPVIAPILKALGDNFFLWGEIIATVIKGVFDVLNSILDFLNAVFEGDWEGAWEAVQGIFSAHWETIKGVLKAVWDEMFGKIGISINDIKTAINTGLETIKNVWNQAWETVSSVVGPVWNNITGVINPAVEGIKSVIGGITDFLSGDFKRSWEGAWSDTTQFFSDIWNGIECTVKTPINAIIGFINSLLSSMEYMVNAIADALNSIQIDIPDWVPFYGGGQFGFSLPKWSLGQVSYLAQGGYVKRNSPRLAMIGDNTREGEIVSPESKIRELTGEAIAQSADAIAEKIADRIQDVMASVAMMNSVGGSDKDVVLVVDSVEIARACIRGQNKLDWKLNPRVQYS